MTLIYVAMICFYTSLFFQTWSLRKKVEEMERIIKSMNDDLNMVSKTMDNMHKHEKAKELSKQILKG
jgi:hypothetical protein